MRTSRRLHIGPDQAERLLAAGRDPAYPQLSRLLRAAAGPPRRHELARLPAAIAAFEEAGRLALPGAVPRRRRAMRPLAAAAAVAATLVGGVAVAAETGNLPGAPTASGTRTTSAPPETAHTPPGRGPGGSKKASPPGTRGRTLSPTSPAVTGLCRAWDAHRRTSNGQPTDSEAMHDLAAMAGGEDRIPAFCAPVLAGQPTPSRQPGKHPGKKEG